MLKSTGTHIQFEFLHNTISGKPCELFALPESRGGENRLHPVCAEEVDFVAENLLQIDEVPNYYQEYFEYILTSTDLERGSTWIDALTLYRELLNIFNEHN